MDIGLYIMHKLSTDQDLTDLMGAEKIYPVQIDQTASLPAIAYSIISNAGIDSKDGPGGKDTSRIQIDVYAPLYSQVAQIAKKVRLIMDGDAGEYGDNIVEYCRFLNSSDGYNTEKEVYQQSLDFNVRYGVDASIYNPLQIGPGITPAALIQEFANQTGPTITVTVAPLPITDTAKRLQVFRGGRLMVLGHDYTINHDTDTITWTLENLGEYVIVYIY